MVVPCAMVFFAKDFLHKFNLLSDTGKEIILYVLTHIVNERSHFRWSLLPKPFIRPTLIQVMTMLIPIWTNSICSQNNHGLPTLTHPWLILNPRHKVGPPFTIALMRPTSFSPVRSNSAFAVRAITLSTIVR